MWILCAGMCWEASTPNRIATQPRESAQNTQSFVPSEGDFIFFSKLGLPFPAKPPHPPRETLAEELATPFRERWTRRSHNPNRPQALETPTRWACPDPRVLGNECRFHRWNFSGFLICMTCRTISPSRTLTLQRWRFVLVGCDCG